MIVLMARAWTRYEGRIQSELPLADVLIMIRDPALGGDGSVLVHGMHAGLPPKNWMPPGSKMEEFPGGYLFTFARSPSVVERLEIYIDKIYSRQEVAPELEAKNIKLGAEREFSDLLAENVERIRPDLRLVAREYRTMAGPMDLLCVDADGVPVCIEVKRVKIFPNAIWQMRRYLDAISRHPEWESQQASGIMVAPSIAKPASALLKQDPLISFVRLSYEDLCPQPADQPQG